MKLKETAFEINPAHSWYLELSPEERKIIDERYMIGEIAEMEMDGKELIEYIYDQEVVIPRSS